MSLSVFQKFIYRFYSHNSFDVVQFLVEKAGVNIEQQDSHGRTALDHAIKSENEEIIQYLQAAMAEQRVAFKFNSNTERRPSELEKLIE